MADDADAATPDPTRSKVGRLLAAHGLDGLGAELEARWVGRGYDAESLRSLADRFNARLLAARLAAAGESPIEGEAENLRRLLTDDGVGAGARVDAESRLERAGVDPDDLRREFVSHQAIHTYLREYRGASKETGGGGVEDVRGTVRRLRGRLAAVTESGLASLASAGAITLGEFDVLVEVRVFCEDCGAARPVTELLAEGGCDCPPEEPPAE